jgi:hypothetical protein
MKYGGSVPGSWKLAMADVVLALSTQWGCSGGAGSQTRKGRQSYCSKVEISLDFYSR